MKKVIAIIVTFKRKHLLCKVIESILNQTVKPMEIIIIDNNSNDGTREVVKKFFNNGRVNISYYNTGANLGGAGGFKIGIQKALERKSEYIWLMDDDLSPDEHCLEYLLDSVNSSTICQPMRLNVDSTCAEYSPTCYDLKSVFTLRPKRETVINFFNSKKDAQIDLHGIPFEGPLIPTPIVSQIGLPDERFFIFYDDLDYALRARKIGCKIKCITKAKATRLLQNNQVNDLSSWKGYFMLRNFFRIHLIYGENIFVRSRPLLITIMYILKSILTGNVKAARICFDAYIDHKSKSFRTSRRYIP
ncbi:glycosyltransferase [Escherichia coli]|uniref:Glycosyltransferase n=1 Tax=Escherichia coli TaxID=562 RepID=A0A6N8NBK9_ECOLX|nr:glycosyltransferase family 2 protein [Escherichia coli]KAB3055320.1 glycosyltransferase [Escherichia coli]KAB3097550.1 glycosyltransferase [Escherichia coli]KAB3171982.1 glycosyltransferase [Escherichia coli]MWQ90320.1 glycosyltransferase [Escherichia coli]MWR05808.1 glycosyltransferase [Escherichia coli]